MIPSVRYCEHNLKRSAGDEEDVTDLLEMAKVDGMDDNMKAKLDAVLAETLQKQAEGLTEVEFNGERIPIRAEKVKVSILQAQETALEVDRSGGHEAKMEAFDKLFLRYNDAVEAIAKEQQAQSQKQ